mmetsp:Transcript_24887/g.76841  ORF Transcript_24887/g.76841 Transcript_24887/m.76841 type:complete len:319 (+) Transcript_24887:51-1007(+)
MSKLFFSKPESLFVLGVDEWLTETRPNPKAKLHVVLVFQTNCPECIVSALPALLQLAAKHKTNSDVSFYAVATAFEDFEWNTLEKARALVQRGEVYGATKARALRETGQRFNDFSNVSVAFDELTDPTPERVESQARLILQAMKNQSSLAVSDETALQRVKEDLRKRPKFATTFDGNALLGTPSWILYEPQSTEIYEHYFGRVAALDVEKLVQSTLQVMAIPDEELVPVWERYPMPKTASEMFFEMKAALDSDADRAAAVAAVALAALGLAEAAVPERPQYSSEAEAEIARAVAEAGVDLYRGDTGFATAMMMHNMVL